MAMIRQSSSRALAGRATTDRPVRVCICAQLLAVQRMEASGSNEGLRWNGVHMRRWTRSVLGEEAKLQAAVRASGVK